MGNCVFCVKKATEVTKQLKCAHVFAYTKGNEKFPDDAAHTLFGHLAYTSAFLSKIVFEANWMHVGEGAFVNKTIFVAFYFREIKVFETC